MAGKLCPNCGEMTLFKTNGANRECSKCGFKVTIPPNGGKGGRGKKCVNCGQFTVFKNQCTNCGAIYEYPKK